MPKSVNKVILIWGTLAKTLRSGTSQSGTPSPTLALATNGKVQRPKTTHGTDRTQWHTIVAWQRLAETRWEHVAKGSKVVRSKGKRPEATKLEDAGRAGEEITALKSSLATCSCSARGETAAATTNVRRTMRIRTSLPTPAPAKSWTRIFHSEAECAWRFPLFSLWMTSAWWLTCRRNKTAHLNAPRIANKAKLRT